MGRVAGAFGVRGWIKVRPYTETPQSLTRYRHWRLEKAGSGREYEIAECEVHGDQVVARLAGVADREAAARLKGCEILVPRTALPPAREDEVYWADLIGSKVVNLQGDELGEVAEVFSNGAHEVLRVSRNGEERLIPFVAAFVRTLDVAARRIEVEWGVDW
jgi:16S rRNA processing protein RimM